MSCLASRPRVTGETGETLHGVALVVHGALRGGIALSAGKGRGKGRDRPVIDVGRDTRQETDIVAVPPRVRPAVLRLCRSIVYGSGITWCIGVGDVSVRAGVALPGQIP